MQSADDHVTVKAEPTDCLGAVIIKQEGCADEIQGATPTHAWGAPQPQSAVDAVATASTQGSVCIVCVKAVGLIEKRHIGCYAMYM